MSCNKLTNRKPRKYAGEMGLCTYTEASSYRWWKCFPEETKRGEIEKYLYIIYIKGLMALLPLR